jgi:hypothetical protein
VLVSCKLVWRPGLRWKNLDVHFYLGKFLSSSAEVFIVYQEKSTFISEKVEAIRATLAVKLSPITIL